MDQLINSEPGKDRRKAGRSLVPGEFTQVAEPYRGDNNVFPYSPYGPQIEAEPRFNIFHYLRIVTKYRWLIAGMTVCAIILATVITLLMTPIYKASASLQIERDVINVVGVGAIQMPEEKGSSLEFYQTQYELLASQSLAERV